MARPDVYAYLDYRKYLRDWFDARKAGNPRFSHRAFARRAGQSSPSLLLHVIDHRRNLTPATVDAFARAMDLSSEEAQFFATLVRLDQADTQEERNRVWEDVSATRRFREARRLEGDGVEYFSRWYYAAIRELAACEEFQADPAWIAETLRPSIDVEQAAAALALLLRIGLLEPDTAGRIRVAEASIVTPHEVSGLIANNYHRGMIACAMESIGKFKSAERHYCAVTVPIPLALVSRLKQELDNFQERILDLCDGSLAPKERVYQVNFQLVPLTIPLPTDSD